MAASKTGSRVLQACVKHGNPNQRAQILEELQPSFLELSKSPYAHHLVCKLIDTAPKSATEGEVPFLYQPLKVIRICTRQAYDVQYCVIYLIPRMTTNHSEACLYMPSCLFIA